LKSSLNTLARALCFFSFFSSHSVFAAEGSPPIDIKTIVKTEDRAKEAYLWGYPYVKFERTKKLMTTTPGYGHAPLNSFFHARRSAQPGEKGLSNPLPDTLFSSAFVDLRQQPLVLSLPKISDRYFSLQFMDASGSNVALLSSRTHGESPGRFFITGPHFIGTTPLGFQHIHSTTNFLWIIGHIAAVTPDQVRKATALLNKYELQPYDVYIGKTKPAKVPRLKGTYTQDMDPRKISEAGVQFYDELGQALQENEPSNLDSALISRFRSIEVGSGLKTSAKTTLRELREAYERAIAAAEMELDKTVKNEILAKQQGWSYVLRPDDFGKNYALRAAVSKVYFAEPASVEALHPVTSTDRNGVRLNGNNTYLLRFEKGQTPPARSFWSLVPYNLQSKSLVQNNLNRYSLGSYSKDLAPNADGSIDIYLSANEPQGHTTNWLPTPRGNFYVMLNIYQPGPEIFDGKYLLPRPQKITFTRSLSSR